MIAAAQCASPTSAPFRALQSNRRTTRRNHRAVHRAVFRHLSESGRDFQVNFSPAGPSRCRDPWICANFPATSSNFHRAAELRRRALRRGGHASWAVKRRGFGCEGTCTEKVQNQSVSTRRHVGVGFRVHWQGRSKVAVQNQSVSRGCT